MSTRHKSKEAAKRVIQIKDGVIGPTPPQSKTFKIRNIGDYAKLPAVYREIAKNYSSPWLVGPPICDEYMALIEHMFTAEEASVVRHLKPFTRKTAKEVAAAEHRPVEEIRPILESLTHDKHIIISIGTDDNTRYMILPIVPGTFELVLIRHSKDTLNDWHRKFAELFEELHETGYMVDYLKHPLPGVRYLPIGQSIEGHPQALPVDKLEEILDRFDKFAVGLCQCRLTMEVVGKDCGRPLENCTGFGNVEYLIREGMMRPAEKKEILEIKREAEASGLVTWMFNHDSATGINGSCSCCGCCCHMMRTISEFSMPGMIAPPHLMPKVDRTKCTYCAKCAQACPMGAFTVDTKNKTRLHKAERCVGCGQCLLACDQEKAITMDAVPNYKMPPKTMPTLLMKLAPSFIKNTYAGWRAHKF